MAACLTQMDSGPFCLPGLFLSCCRPFKQMNRHMRSRMPASVAPACRLSSSAQPTFSYPSTLKLFTYSICMLMCRAAGFPLFCLYRKCRILKRVSTAAKSVEKVLVQSFFAVFASFLQFRLWFSTTEGIRFLADIAWNGLLSNDSTLTLKRILVVHY